MSKRIATLIAVLVGLVLVLSGCGGGEMSDEEAANEAWESISSEDQDALCDAYELFGPQFLQDMFQDLNEANGPLNERQAEIAAGKVIKECSSR